MDSRITESDRLIREILGAVTTRYVRNSYKIPADILALKDEVMEIYSKLHRESSPEESEKHLGRLKEIYTVVFETNYAPPM